MPALIGAHNPPTASVGAPRGGATPVSDVRHDMHNPSQVCAQQTPKPLSSTSRHSPVSQLLLKGSHGAPIDSTIACPSPRWPTETPPKSGKSDCDGEPVHALARARARAYDCRLANPTRFFPHANFKSRPKNEVKIRKPAPNQNYSAIREQMPRVFSDLAIDAPRPSFDRQPTKSP